jgi:glutamate--cysteine ligase
MPQVNDNLIRFIDSSVLADQPLGMVGLEKESLRIFENSISKISHKKYLGSALYNQYITTDFAEAQIELVTPAFSEKPKLIDFLECLHRFSYERIEREYLWPFSMPPIGLKENDIEIAKFGKSNKARFKEIYRRGLSARYGKKMQTISGSHYNYSLNKNFLTSIDFNHEETSEGELTSNLYFRMLRNIQRYNWIILYFFGCSPFIDHKLASSEHDFKTNNKGELYIKNATSLRMSPMGYQSKLQSSLNISLDSLKSYIKDMKNATSTLSLQFQTIDAISKQKHMQLNANILQVEDEYYGFSRPKNNNSSDMRQLSKLHQHGVNYIEFRSLDLNPFSHLGIDSEQLDFLEIFLIYCLVSSSPFMTDKEMKESYLNSKKVSVSGRKDGLLLSKNGEPISLNTWAKEIMSDIAEIADLFFKGSIDIENFFSQIDNPKLTLSGSLMQMLEEKNIGFTELGFILADEHKNKMLKKEGINQSYMNLLFDEMKRSLITESNEHLNKEETFEKFLIKYLE